MMVRAVAGAVETRPPNKRVRVPVPDGAVSKHAGSDPRGAARRHC